MFVEDRKYIFEVITYRKSAKIYDWNYFEVDFIFEFRPYVGYYQSYKGFQSYCLN